MHSFCVRRGIRLRLLIALLAILYVTPTRAAKFDWDPEHTWVFAVGLLQWQHGDIWPSFPAAMKNRRDAQLVKHFRQAGVPEEQVVYLQDAQATKKKIEKAFKDLLGDTDEGDLLIFYFAGHGYRDVNTGETWFANYDAGQKDSSGWNVRSIFKTIESEFSGNRVLLLADCCHSGALYDEALKRRSGEVAYAALTSSYSHNTSTGNWTFSDSLLAGLRGEPTVDANGDRLIELHELALYTELEMAFIEGQKSMFSAAQKFPRQAKLAATQGTALQRVGERVEAWSEGKWYKAKILATQASQIKVHYIGWDAKWDEWLPNNYIRAYQPYQYAVGTKVMVMADDEKWYPAVVQQAWQGLHFIHYDDYDATWDEWVGPSAIRARK
jgi:hypothetical protein